MQGFSYQRSALSLELKAYKVFASALLVSYNVRAHGERLPQ